MVNPIAALTAIANAVAGVTKELEHRSELRNTPEMQHALVIHRIQEVLDDQRKAISDENIDSIRKLVAAPDAGS